MVSAWLVIKLFIHFSHAGTKDDRFIKDVDKISYSDFDLVPSSPSNLIGFPSTETSVYLSWLQTKPTSHSTIYFRYFTLYSSVILIPIPSRYIS